MHFNPVLAQLQSSATKSQTPVTHTHYVLPFSGPTGIEFPLHPSAFHSVISQQQKNQTGENREPGEDAELTDRRDGHKENMWLTAIALLMWSSTEIMPHRWHERCSLKRDVGYLFAWESIFCRVGREGVRLFPSPPRFSIMCLFLLLKGSQANGTGSHVGVHQTNHHTHRDDRHRRSEVRRIFCDCKNDSKSLWQIFIFPHIPSIRS